MITHAKNWEYSGFPFLSMKLWYFKTSSYYDQEKLKLLSNVDLIKQFIKQFINKNLEDPTNRKLFFKVLLNSAFIYENHIDFYLNFDVAEQITFEQYKNDVLELENVRFSNLLAE